MIRNFLLKTLNKYASKWFVLFIDILLVCFSFILAYSIRFNVSFDFEISNLLTQLPFIAIVSLISFLLIGSYKGIIRHTGPRDAFNVFIGATIIAFIVVAVVLINRLFKINEAFTIPISIIVIHYLVATFTLIVSRYIFKAFYDIVSSELSEITNVLIYGAGDSGIITYGALNRGREESYEVAGFIDDDKNKVNKKINRVKVFSMDDITPGFVEKNDIDEIIISIQGLKPQKLLTITDRLISLDVKVKIVPPLRKWIDGDLEVNQIRQVKIEDLLERAPINIENPILQRDVNNKVIVVTGAAGSIGSEILRQLSKYNYQHLILIDQAESPLYDLQQELKQKNVINFTAIVADVRDVKRMRVVFEEFKPHKVFHAAAYKHVPLMEESPYEAVKINIGGTKNIADLSLEFDVERFVMVSTDKAVNPTNVMGATKRVAEMYISCLSKKSTTTKFTITRFGNVLGSNGSVIPLFKKQIEKGGPLTVTHKDITRYFMTIPEACRLVLEAGTMGNGGEIYIFDMGESVKIFDVAKKMIHLSGLEYPDDIDIIFTGLRPGEKLFEELLANGENTTKTYHEKIMIAKSQDIDACLINDTIVELCKENKEINDKKTVGYIKKIVPEYKSKNSEYEILDKVKI